MFKSDQVNSNHIKANTGYNIKIKSNQTNSKHAETYQVNSESNQHQTNTNQKQIISNQIELISKPNQHLNHTKSTSKQHQTNINSQVKATQLNLKSNNFKTNQY